MEEAHVDHPADLHVLSLCAGIGGLDLGVKGGAERLGLRAVSVGYVEREVLCAATLGHHAETGALDPGPLWTDLRTFDGRAWRGAVDCVTAGFPCPAFSTASRGRRVAEDLWPECLRIIEEVGPRFVFLENVQRDPIDAAGRQLVALGYDCAYAPLAASQVGAPHERQRWWLLADADGDPEPAFALHGEVARVSPAPHPDWWREPLGRVVDVVHGVPRELALTALGNAVVPAQAELAFVHLWRALS